MALNLLKVKDRQKGHDIYVNTLAKIENIVDNVLADTYPENL